MQILIAEDFAQFRELIASTLELKLHVKPVCVANGFEAVERAAHLRPDLVLLDIGLPKMSGIEAARQIRQVSPESKIIFISMLSSPAVVQEALSIGGLGFVHKTDAAMELMTAVTAVLRGERFVSSSLTARIQAPPATRLSAG